jgi:hypothetical protein
MKISYITTDLEFDSGENLSPVAEELGGNVIVHLNEWVGDVYRVALGIADNDTSAADAVSFYCSLIEKLSDPAKVLWNRCTRRVLDIAFESGTEPESATHQLPEALVHRLSALRIGIAITIYRLGAYSDPGGE